MARRTQETGSRNGEPEYEEVEGEVPRLAVEGLKGVLRITGYAVLAMIAGYSAGYAMQSYQDAKGRGTGAPATH